MYPECRIQKPAPYRLEATARAFLLPRFLDWHFNAQPPPATLLRLGVPMARPALRHKNFPGSLYNSESVSYGFAIGTWYAIYQGLDEE